jgi:5-methylthioadenosine/S-adenosylhomocysteine deaminase
VRAGWILPVAEPPIRDGAVAADGGEVLAVGPYDGLARTHPAAKRLDLGDCVAIPGLVDAHCHLEWSLLGGLIAGDGFAGWLGRFLRLRLRMGSAEHRAAAALGALRALEAGTTTVADSGPTGAGAVALTAAGLRGRVHLESFGRQEGAAATEAARRHAEAVAALDADAGHLVEVGVSPHAPYTVSPDLWRALAARDDLAGRAWAMHLAESPDESRLMAHGDGPLAALFAQNGLVPGRWPGRGGSPVARLAGAGALRPGLVAAHCVRLVRRDPDRLAAARVAVAHCPQSNAYLRCGRAPVAALRAAGVAVGLGTDSPASAGAYDVRAEARAAALVAGADGDAAPSADALLEMATLGGARALGMDDRVGALMPGRRLDLVALEPSAGAGPGDPAAAAIDPLSRVRVVIVDGRVILRDGAPLTVDREAVATAAAEARRHLC